MATRQLTIERSVRALDAPSTGQIGPFDQHALSRHSAGGKAGAALGRGAGAVEINPAGRCGKQDAARPQRLPFQIDMAGPAIERLAQRQVDGRDRGGEHSVARPAGERAGARRSGQMRLSLPHRDIERSGRVGQNTA